MLMEKALDNTIEKLKLVVEKMKVVGDGECWTVEEHEQIVKWLEELKELRMSAEKILPDYERSYNKAIEDMVSSLIRNSSTEAIDGNVTLVVTDERIKFIAKQLKKANMKNEKKKQRRTIVEQETINRLSFIRGALFGGIKLEIIPNEKNIKLMDTAIEALENIIEIKNHKITLLDLKNYMKFEDECVKKNFMLKSLLEAREKQIAKKPTYEGDGYDSEGNFVYDTWICPCCEKRYEVDYDEYDFARTVVKR